MVLARSVYPHSLLSWHGSGPAFIFCCFLWERRAFLPRSLPCPPVTPP